MYKLRFPNGLMFTESSQGQSLHYVQQLYWTVEPLSPPGKPNLTYPHKDMPHTGRDLSSDLSDALLMTPGTESDRAFGLQKVRTHKLTITRTLEVMSFFFCPCLSNCYRAVKHRGQILQLVLFYLFFYH